MESKRLGETVGQVVVVGARNAEIDFLQTEDVGARLMQNFGDAFRAVTAVRSDRFVYIISQESQYHDHASLWTLRTRS